GKGTTLGKRSDFWKTCGGFSGPHDAPAGRPLLDHTLSALPLRGTSLGRGHSSASALLGHVDRMASVYFALLFAGPLGNQSRSAVPGIASTMSGAPSPRNPR